MGFREGLLRPPKVSGGFKGVSDDLKGLQGGFKRLQEVSGGLKEV